ncbi:MAG: hypothetical protein ACE5KV_07565 [Thermoplasmata archaeon]
MSDNAKRSIEILGLMMRRNLTRPRDIWKCLEIARSTVSTLLTRLESAGLVKRVGYANWKITKKGIREYDRHTEMRNKVFESAKEAAIDIKDGDILSFIYITASLNTDLPLEDSIENLRPVWEGKWSEREGDIIFDISFPPGFQILFIFQSEPKVLHMFATAMKGDPEDVIFRILESGPGSMFITLLGNVNWYFHKLEAVMQSVGGELVITSLSFTDMIRDTFWGDIGSGPWSQWLSRVVSLSRLREVPLELR